MNRCRNSLFDYCLHEPDPIDTPSYKLVLDYRGTFVKVPFTAHECTKDPLTCGDHLTFSESLAIPQPAPPLKF